MKRLLCAFLLLCGPSPVAALEIVFPTLADIRVASCQLYDRMVGDVYFDRCDTDACLRNLIKPKRVCDWRIDRVEAACVNQQPHPAREALNDAYQAVRNHIGQMLHHCLYGDAPCDRMSDYIGVNETKYVLPPVVAPVPTGLFGEWKARLWEYGDLHLLPFPLRPMDLDLMGAMRQRLNREDVCSDD